MKMKLGTLLGVMSAAVLLFFCFRAKTQAQENQDYQAIADKFFVLVEQGKSDDAIDYLFGTNVALKNLPGKSEQLKAQLSELERQLGSYHSHVRLAESKISDMFVYQHYAAFYDQQPISIRLKFYKARDTWRVFGVEFDSNLADLIEKETDQNLYRQFK